MELGKFKNAVELDYKIKDYKYSISSVKSVIDTENVTRHVSMEIPYEMSKKIAKLIESELCVRLSELEDEFNKL